MFRFRRRSWILRRFVLGLAVAAVVAPTAQARVTEGTSAQTNSAEASTFIAGVTDVPTPASYGLEPVQQISTSDFVPGVTDVPTPASYGLEPVQQAPRVASPAIIADPGFNWGDAGVGAGLALMLVLLGGGAVLAMRHLGKAQTA